MNIIIEAAQYAALAHAGQRRKYNGDPYIFHPLRVASRLMMVEQVSEYAVAAALCHDVKEDCPGFWPIPAIFPVEVVRLIEELTNPSKDFPTLGRAERVGLLLAGLLHLHINNRWHELPTILRHIFR